MILSTWRRIKGTRLLLRYFGLFALVILSLNAKTILLSGIEFYQRNISPIPGVECRYAESCSNYAERMVQQRGAVIGPVLTVERLWQCSRIQTPYIQKNDDLSDKEAEAEAKACAYGCCGTGILAILVPIFIGILVCGVLMALTIFLIRRSKQQK